MKAYVDGYNERLFVEQKHAIFQGWHTAIFHRAKHVPALASIYADMERIRRHQNKKTMAQELIAALHARDATLTAKEVPDGDGR